VYSTPVDAVVDAVDDSVDVAVVVSEVAGPVQLQTFLGYHRSLAELDSTTSIPLKREGNAAFKTHKPIFEVVPTHAKPAQLLAGVSMHN
jgi:hypothetical protein